MSITMTISINGAHVGAVSGIPFSPGMNVQQAMEAAYTIQDAPVNSFTLQYFGTNLGYEVVQLDGISNQAGANATTYLFWALSVNGTLASFGIDSTILDDGDEIGWNYEVFDPGTHGGTRHEEIRTIVAAPVAATLAR